MSKFVKLVLSVVIGIALVCVAFYSALPDRITAVQAIRTGDTEAALKIVGDAGEPVGTAESLKPGRPVEHGDAVGRLE